MAQVHTDSGQITSLCPLGSGLRASRTTAILKARQLELVRIVLHAGSGLPQHSAPGEITLQCIEGTFELATPSLALLMSTGDLVHLTAHEPHALRAVTDTSILLTMCLLPG